MMKNVKDEKCIAPDCENKQHCRGLCQKCYEAAHSRIRRDPKAEKQLVKAGLMLPAKPRGRKPKSALGKALAAKK